MKIRQALLIPDPCVTLYPESQQSDLTIGSGFRSLDSSKLSLRCLTSIVRDNFLSCLEDIELFAGCAA